MRACLIFFVSNKSDFSFHCHRLEAMSLNCCLEQVFISSFSFLSSENSGAEEGEGELGAQLRAGGGVSHQRPLQEAGPGEAPVLTLSVTEQCPTVVKFNLWS